MFFQVLCCLLTLLSCSSQILVLFCFWFFFSLTRIPPEEHVLTAWQAYRCILQGFMKTSSGYKVVRGDHWSLSQASVDKKMKRPLCHMSITLAGCSVFLLLSRKLDLEWLPLHALWHYLSFFEVLFLSIMNTVSLILFLLLLVQYVVLNFSVTYDYMKKKSKDKWEAGERGK